MKLGKIEPPLGLNPELLTCKPRALTTRPVEDLSYFLKFIFSQNHIQFVEVQRKHFCIYRLNCEHELIRSERCLILESASHIYILLVKCEDLQLYNKCAKQYVKENNGS